MFPSKHSNNTELVMPLPVAKFENQVPNMSILFIIHTAPVKRFYNTELLISIPVTKFGNQMPNMSTPSVLYLISAEQDVLALTYNKSEKTKMGLGEEGARPNKKQKIVL
jgi:hypothetical protein